MREAVNAEAEGAVTAASPPALPGRALAEELHETEFAFLVRFLLFQGATLSEAQDAVQDAFTQMCRPGTRVTHPKAWLRTVARRSWIRQQVRVEETYAELPERGSVAHWETPLHAVEIGDEERRVIALLQPLPAKQRAAMTWLLDGFTTEEIAREMGISQHAVRQNVKRARESLKAGLGLQQPDER